MTRGGPFLTAAEKEALRGEFETGQWSVRALACQFNRSPTTIQRFAKATGAIPPRRCGACRHSRVGEIDALIEGGATYPSVAERFDLSRTVVHGHAVVCRGLSRIGRGCYICRDHNAANIASDLASGMFPSEVARTYGLSSGAVFNHSRACLNMKSARRGRPCPICIHPDVDRIEDACAGRRYGVVAATARAFDVSRDVLYAHLDKHVGNEELAASYALEALRRLAVLTEV